MPTYTVDPAQVTAFMQAAEEVDRSIRTQLDALTANLQDQLKEWTSEAQTVYARCQQQWNEAAAKLPVALGSATQQLGVIQQGYGAAEDTGKGLWKFGA
ncbi:WXG100 family type VII secretion target [Amycolatopsis japonica]